MRFGVFFVALSRAVASTTQPATNTTVSITGLSFQPKVAIFLFGNATADGASDDCAVGIGFACDTPTTGTTQSAMWATNDDGQADTVVCNRATASDAVLITSPTGTVLGLADVSAWNSDGLTLNWTSVDGTQRIVAALLLGGDIVGKAGAQTRPTVTGNQTVTVADLVPTALLTVGGGDHLTALDANNTTNCGFVLGATDGTSQWASGWGARGARTTGDGNTYQRTTVCAVSMASALIAEAAFSSFDSTSGGRFTLNWTTVNARAGYYLWLALAGTDVSFKSGAFTTDTDLGAQAVTGVGFQPQVGLFASFNRTATTAVSTESHNSFGMVVSSTERAAQWCGGDNGAATTDEQSVLDRDEVILSYLALLGGAPSVDALGDFTSWDTDGFTLDWTDAPGSAFQAVYFVMKGAAAAVKAPSPLPRPYRFFGGPR